MRLIFSNAIIALAEDRPPHYFIGEIKTSFVTKKAYYDIIPENSQDVNVNLHLQRLREKYLHDWERQATLILLAAALLLMLHRHYNRTRFFRIHFATFFENLPLPESHPYYYWFLTTSITLFCLPALIAKYGTKIHLRDYGFRLGNQKLGWSVTAAAWIVMIPIVISAVLIYPPFSDKYPLCKAVDANWQAFLLYQLAYGIYMFSWEFFFRGFMLFGLERQFGKYTILIQTIPFAVMHYSKPMPEAIGSIVASVLLGVLALETRSFLYGAAIHWLVAMTMDVVVTVLRFA